MSGNGKDNNLSNTPYDGQLKLNEFNYCCTDCLSLIEILHIKNNNIIEFKCSNKNKSHQKSIDIKQYLEKRKQNVIKNSIVNRDICNEHGQKFISYCFECNKHICEKCQNKGVHLLHYKINIIEIEPTKVEKEILNKIIEYYDEQIDKLSRENISKIKKIKNISKRVEEKITKIKKEKIKECKSQKELELKKIKEKYLNDIKIMKNEFDKNLKKLKLNYMFIYNKINNEFKLKEEKIFYFFLNREENFNKKINKYSNELESTKIKIDNLNNIKTLNELVYNTYNEYPKNIFNIINISQMIINQNDENSEIKNEIISKIIKNNNETIFPISRKITSFKKAFQQKITFKTEIIPKERQDIKNNIINNTFISNYNSANKQSIRKTYKKAENKINDNLFLLFNNIFYKNKEQTSINYEKINEIHVENLRQKYFKYKKENNQNMLINYFDNFLKCNVLKIFENEKKYINNERIDIIKYNIETICELFELNKNKYKDYYFQNSNRRLIDRKKSGDAARQFRKEFNIDDSIIKEEELLKKLDKNDNDIKKVFQLMYG